METTIKQLLKDAILSIIVEHPDYKAENIYFLLASQAWYFDENYATLGFDGMFHELKEYGEKTVDWWLDQVIFEPKLAPMKVYAVYQLVLYYKEEIVMKEIQEVFNEIDENVAKYLK